MERAISWTVPFFVPKGRGGSRARRSRETPNGRSRKIGLSPSGSLFFGVTPDFQQTVLFELYLISLYFFIGLRGGVGVEAVEGGVGVEDVAFGVHVVDPLSFPQQQLVGAEPGLVVHVAVSRYIIAQVDMVLFES
jgi:hypothetical protein